MNKAENRNVGLDLLRFLSILGIIGLHVLNAGGALDASSSRVATVVMDLMYVVFLTSVNVFAMLSGYLYISRKFRGRNLVNLLAICLFYFIVITAILAVFFPEFLAGGADWAESLIPMQFGAYWYMLCYIFLFFMIPFINSLLLSLSQKRFQNLILLLFITLSVLPTLGGKDYFATGFGYSPMWLITCYIIGAYVNIYGLPVKRAGLVWVLCVVTAIGFWLFPSILGKFTGVYLPFRGQDYTSVFIVLESVLLLVIFSRMKIPAAVCPLIVRLSSWSFGAYVLHCHPILYARGIVGWFAVLPSLGVAGCVLGTAVSCLAIYFMCIPFELVRIPLFKTRFLSAVLNRIGSKLDSLYSD